jgi:hypothetical protein
MHQDKSSFFGNKMDKTGSVITEFGNTLWIIMVNNLQICGTRNKFVTNM